jgi:hypothetical protein
MCKTRVLDVKSKDEFWLDELNLLQEQISASRHKPYVFHARNAGYGIAALNQPHKGIGKGTLRGLNPRIRKEGQQVPPGRILLAILHFCL